MIALACDHGALALKEAIKKHLDRRGLAWKDFGTDSLEVNSSHHQAVKDLAPGLKVTARSHDGIVEAYEGDNLTAVQFHPEKLVRSGSTQWLAFFKLFISKCK